MTELPSPDALARAIIVRHRGDGHVRFAVPAVLCAEERAAAIEAALRRMDGVYRVTLYRRQGKLSVFYDAHSCTLADIARTLHGSLTSLAPGAPGGTGKTMAQRLRAPASWLRVRGERARAWLEEWRFKGHLLKQVIAYHPQMSGLFSERAVINFLNDLVVFYLIKQHWDMITQKWIKHPVQFRNAWLSTFYLVFLLVRYRKRPDKKG